MTTSTARHRNPMSPTMPAWFGPGSILLGLGAAAVALLGPLATGVIRYHASPGAVSQIAGGDLAGLLLACPVAIAAGILSLRHHPAGPVLVLGPAVYAVYTYTQLALGGDVVRYEGNSEQFFPLFVGLFVLAGALAVRAWAEADPDTLPPTSRRIEAFLGMFLLVVALFLVVGLHLRTLIDAMSGSPTGPEYLADPGPFWLVKLMDLGIVVPALTAIGVGLLRRAGWARRATYAAVGWFALLGTSVAGMASVMQATGDPAASTANTATFASFAAVGLAIAVVVYRPLFRPSGDGKVTTDLVTEVPEDGHHPLGVGSGPQRR